MVSNVPPGIAENGLQLCRLTGCPLTDPVSGESVPLLPVSIYGASLVEVLSYSHTVFADLKIRLGD